MANIDIDLDEILNYNRSCRTIKLVSARDMIENISHLVSYEFSGDELSAEFVRAASETSAILTQLIDKTTQPDERVYSLF